MNYISYIPHWYMIVHILRNDPTYVISYIINIYIYIYIYIYINIYIYIYIYIYYIYIYIYIYIIFRVLQSTQRQA